MGDWIGKLLAWLEPWLAYLLGLMGEGSILGLGAAVLGQGLILVAAGTYVGTLPNLKRFAGYRVAINRVLALVLILAATYFAWRAFGSLMG